MPSDPTKRIANWNTKYDTARIKEVLDQKRPKMYEHVQAVIPQITSMEAQVKQTLDALGATVIEYPFYLGFAREMWRLVQQNEMSGEALAVEADLLISKWASRGLTRSVLEAIRSQNFSVGPPSSP